MDCKSALRPCHNADKEDLFTSYHIFAQVENKTQSHSIARLTAFTTHIFNFTKLKFG